MARVFLVGWLLAFAPASAATVVKIIELEEPVEPQTRERIQQVVDVMTRFHATYTKLPRKINIRVRLFEYQKDYRRYRDSKGVSAQADWGYYSPTDKEMVVFEKQFRWEQTLLHEASHHLNRVIVGHLPTALEEGLAEFFETGYPRNGQVVFVPKRKELAGVQRWQRVGRLPRLKDLLAATHAEFHHLTQQSRGSRTYDVAYSLVYFMMKTKERRAILARLLGKWKAGDRTILRVIENEYPGGLYRLERDWHTFLSRPFADVIFESKRGFTP